MTELALVGLGLAALIVLVLLVVLVFEIVMFVHTIQNQSISNDRKLLWLVGMIVLHPFVAIAYYLTDYQGAKS